MRAYESFTRNLYTLVPSYLSSSFKREQFYVHNKKSGF